MDSVKLLTVFILLAPFLSFFLNGIITPLRRSGRPAGYLSILLILISTILSLKLLLFVLSTKGSYQFSFLWIPLSFLKPVKLSFLIDPLSSSMFFIVSLVSLCVQVYSLGYMSGETPPSLGRYYTYHSLFSFSMLSLVASSNLLGIYIFWELVGLCSYLLIGFWYYKPEAARAAVKAFWVTRFGDVGFAIGIVILWSIVGTFELTDIFHVVRFVNISQFALLVIVLLIFAGAMGKSAQFPLHIWLPDAMEGPTPVSALIHAATMVAAGVYLVARVFPLFEFAHTSLLIILHIGAFTAFLAATMAIVQEDIKKILAYSTISQLGYMMAALGAGSVGAGFFHLTTHAFFKALLFLAAGSVIHSIGTNDIWKMGRLWKKMPQTAIVFVIGALALSGLPPFSGFFSKDEILVKVLEKGFLLPAFFVMATVFLTAFYMFRLIFTVFWSKRESSGHPHESPFSMTLPMWLLAILSVVAGFPKDRFMKFITGAESVHHGGLNYLLPLSVLLALSGIVLAWLIYEREWIERDKIARPFIGIYNILRRKYFLDDFYGVLYKNGLLIISHTFGFFDRYIVDGMVNFVSWLVSRTGIALRTLQSGKIQDYLYGIILGVLFLMLLGYFR